MRLSRIQQEGLPSPSPSDRVVLSVQTPDQRVIREIIRLAAHHTDGPDEAERLAVTAILISAAGSDKKYNRSEIRRVYNLLESWLRLSPQEIHRFIKRVAVIFAAQGRRTVTRHALRYIGRRRTRLFHMQLFIMVTRVVRADGVVARGEIRWLKKFVQELGLTHRDCSVALRGLPAVP